MCRLTQIWVGFSVKSPETIKSTEERKNLNIQINMKQTREISHVDICWRERQTTNLRETNIKHHDP